MFPSRFLPVAMLEPAADAAGRTGNYISLKGAVRAFVFVYMNQAAANTVLLSVLQATAVAGTGSKVLANVSPIWTNLDANTAAAFTKQTSAVNYTTDAAVKKKWVIFQIEGSSLDIANGFDCIAISTGASAAANITAAFALLEQRYVQNTPINAIID